MKAQNETKHKARWNESKIKRLKAGPRK